MRFVPLSLALALLAGPALAHVGHDAGGHAGGASLAAGLAHPLGGADHVLAMVAVGLWAALLGGPARLVLPAVFLTVMGAGFLTGLAGLSVPMVEPGIAVSVVVLGVMVAAAVNVPLVAGAVLVGLFALLHGHAHGAEMAGASAAAYAAGFVLATALLHAAGLGLGTALAREPGRRVARGLGAAAALAGLALFASA